MKLYLVQHGLAVVKNEHEQRPLSNQGREDITRVGGFLSLFERPKPIRIVHSDKLRSLQSAEMFAEAWGCSVVEKSSELSSDANPTIWASRLIEIHEDMMLVGHLPHLPRLASLLLCGQAEREVVRFCNAGVVCLQRTENEWSICWQVNPTLFYPKD
ncbi:MAG: phosphohistidine phosphatase SixA [Mariprofundaceae bacterium]|nr:phosphohistidine phosphatase SixA [Mariprofundaceae bacterium]